MANDRLHSPGCPARSCYLVTSWLPAGGSSLCVPTATRCRVTRFSERVLPRVTRGCPLMFQRSPTTGSAHVITEAEESHGVLSASWTRRTRWCDSGRGGPGNGRGGRGPGVLLSLKARERWCPWGVPALAERAHVPSSTCSSTQPSVDGPTPPTWVRAGLPSAHGVRGYGLPATSRNKVWRP